MDKELVKTIITSSVGLVIALTPLIINYFGKKGKESARKNLIEESQGKINFINSYYDSLHRFLPDGEIEVLKSKLALELYELKSKINESNDRHANIAKGAHLTFQRIFLTYKPVTFMGWIWAILFYIDLCIFFIMILGSAIDENTGEFSARAFYYDIFAKGGIYDITIFISSLLLFRWLAIRNYKKNMHLQLTGI
jgi:hypothetical protein